MYLRASLPVPVAPGKIVYRNKGKSRFVLFEIERVYDPKKKFNVPKRVIIGKMQSGDDSSLMIPNDNFFKYFPDTPISSLPPAYLRSQTIRVGAYIAFSCIVEEYKIDKILEDCFDEKASLILDLASYLIICEDNAGQYYPDYARCHAIFTRDMAIYSDSTISRLLSGISPDQVTSFLNAWNGRQDHRQRIYISYDSTNKNSQAGDLRLIEFGHAKVDEGLPIFNIGLAFDKTNQVPLFYETYPGSINDVSQLDSMINKVCDYGYHSVGLILDRGYFSRDNIKLMDEKGMQFLMMVKGCKELVCDLITEHRGTFEEKREHWISETKLYGKTIAKLLYPDDSKKRYFHLFYSPQKMASERDDLETSLENMNFLLKSSEGSEIKSIKQFSDYFILHFKDLPEDKKQLLFAEENKVAIEKALKLCGYFCIISSERMTASEAYNLYRGRDASEKLFRAQKTFLGSKSQRVHSDNALAAKIFIEFIALIIRNRFYNLLKDEMIKLNVRKNWLTVPAAIRELGKIEMARVNDGSYRLNYALTRNQKSILSCFGQSPEKIKDWCSRISKMLTLEKEKLAEQNTEKNDDKTEDDCLN